jgi:hypothetical protein
MKIFIQSILQSDQRYATVGDYQWIADDLYINVTDLPDKRHMYLIAIHELVEALLCDISNVSCEEIDQWDFNWDRPGEPGDNSAAPYFTQHQIATAIEKLCAFEMLTDWAEYEQACNNSLGDF